MIKAEFIKRLRARINQGDSWLSYDLANLARGGEIDEDLIEELESQLVMADVGMETTERIIEGLQKNLARSERKDVAALRDGLRSSLLSILEPVAIPLEIAKSERPFVVLMVGVNGAGKTTTIGKLAKRFGDQGLS
ncbi:MAG: signal recognition particle receptor subunit alpha, partial [Proteobacteria bacterium]|nr:signal recognition particle receptor subunit alpha [Pseudomonadota bacterium]